MSDSKNNDINKSRDLLERFERFENRYNADKSKLDAKKIDAEDKGAQPEELLATEDEKHIKLEKFPKDEVEPFKKEEYELDDTKPPPKERDDNLLDDVLESGDAENNASEVELSLAPSEFPEIEDVPPESGAPPEEVDEQQDIFVEEREGLSGNGVNANINLPDIQPPLGNEGIEETDPFVESLDEEEEVIDPDPPPTIDPDPDPGFYIDPPIPQRLANGNYGLIPDRGVTVNFDTLSTNGTQSNSIGHYFADDNGEPLSGVVHIANQSGGIVTSDNGVVRYEDDEIPPGATQIGIFIIPDGGNLNAGLNDVTDVEFIEVGGVWTPYVNGVPLVGAGAPALFSNSSLNSDSLNHTIFNDDAGEVQWEESFGGGDSDFDDLVIGFTIQSTTSDNGIDDIKRAGNLGESISGGFGDDYIFGGDGNDSLYGDGGNDVIQAGLGGDSIDGGTGNDILEGDAGNDTIDANVGDDSILGGSGDDLIIGNIGDDTVRGGSGQDNIFGGEGDDSLGASDGDDYVEGGLGADTIEGASGANTLLGGAGSDSITGGADADTISGGDGDDTVLGGSGDDVITGDAGSDSIVAGTGDDSVEGGAGDDSIRGDQGKDTIFGGEGDDVIITDFDTL
ncbi:MAG TPA: calcium-binding protein, partial [Candidatus Megaira endosymbiont of Nemacystus decipiens]|nr:calcium-binding protein [Candidatus Megaera endosymbiont of Nemacystus decipiens]